MTRRKEAGDDHDPDSEPEDFEGVPLLVPRDILERTAKVADLEGLSVRSHLMMTAAFISCSGET